MLFLLSGARGKAMVDAIRANRVRAGAGVREDSRTIDGTFLSLSSSGTSGYVCGLYEDFWPSYYEEPTGRWKRYCLRNIECTWNQTTNAVFDVEGDSDWFEPDGEAIPELFEFFDPAATPPPFVTLRLTISLVMYRDVTPNPTPGASPREVPVGSEEDSIPWVEEICWRVL
jgi:hypothetical protein